MNQFDDPPGDDDFDGPKTFAEELAELDREVMERRNDKDSQGRLNRRLTEDAPVLDRLAENGD